VWGSATPAGLSDANGRHFVGPSVSPEQGMPRKQAESDHIRLFTPQRLFSSRAPLPARTGEREPAGPEVSPEQGMPRKQAESDHIRLFSPQRLFSSRAPLPAGTGEREPAGPEVSPEQGTP